jgi:hypothetical protein
MELEKAGPIDLIEKNRLQYFYDRFFMNRIGIRTLIYQHSKQKKNYFINLIQKKNSSF